MVMVLNLPSISSLFSIEHASTVSSAAPEALDRVIIYNIAKGCQNEQRAREQYIRKWTIAKGYISIGNNIVFSQAIPYIF